MEIQITPWNQAYIRNYIVEGTPLNVLSKLRSHVEGVLIFFQSLPESAATHVYQPGKWTVRQVAGHILDSHVIFSYRAYCIARGEKKNLPGFEEKDYAPIWEKNRIPLKEISRLYELQSQSTLAQLGALRPEDLEQMGSANAIGLSPLLIFRAVIGHESHHVKMLRERYGLDATRTAA